MIFQWEAKKRHNSNALILGSHPFLPEALWPTGIVIACVCVCVCLSVCQPLLVRAITHHLLKLGSTNLDQKMQDILLKVPIVLGAN